MDRWMEKRNVARTGLGYLTTIENLGYEIQQSMEIAGFTIKIDPSLDAGEAYLEVNGCRYKILTKETP